MRTISIPAIAFDRQSVYNGILGLSSIHLLSITPNDLALKAATYQYLDQTIASQREEIKAQISTTNAVSVFTTSLLLAIHAKLRAINLSIANEKYAPPLNWFYCFTGLREIAKESIHYIEDSNIRAYAMLNPESEVNHPPPPTPPDPPITFPPDPFLEHWSSLPHISPQNQKIYAQSVAYLSLIKSRMKAGEKSYWIQRRLSIIPGEVSDGFVGLLELEDPIALAILARFFAIMKRVEGTWWLRGTAEFEIRGLSGLIGEDWAWCMAWPLEVLEGGN